jgi:release factor glutamine methyltransferase
VKQLLSECADLIGGNGGDADAREILAGVLDVPRSWPALHLEENVAAEIGATARSAAVLRGKGMPLHYAVGKAAFRHLILNVDHRVLIPRPETEMLIDLIMARAPSGTIADVGTGSGAIAIALATEGAYSRVIATDVSADALEVARGNAARYSERATSELEFRLGSLLQPLAGESLDAIVSNPPYIAENEMKSLPPEVRDWEPALALQGGPEGLDATTGIIAGAPDILVPGGLFALEADSRRAERTADILKADGRYQKIEIIADLTGRPRFVMARRR